MPLDGFCDHTPIAPDVEAHQHYAEMEIPLKFKAYLLFMELDLSRINTPVS